MYDHIFARSFSKNDQKRFRKCAILVCTLVAAFTLCTSFSPSFHLSILKLDALATSSHDTVNLRTPQVEQEMGRKVGKENIKTLRAPSRLHFTKSRRWRKVSSTRPPFVNHIDSESLGKPAHMPPRNDSFKDSHEMGHSVDCSLSEALSDYCSMKGMIRIHGLSSTIFTSNIDANTSWIIKPYPRKGSVAMNPVREWTIKPVNSQDMPICMTTHADPAILFSAGGFSGNHFHEFSDIIIPLFTNSRIFNRKVHLLVTNYKSWWISKFQRLLNHLSDHQVIDIDNENKIHCYQNVIIGLKSHKELGIDALRSTNGYTMKDFREFLRSAYSLERREVIKIKCEVYHTHRPRLMIISRKSTRRILNEESIVEMAQKIGYDVIMADVSLKTNVSSFAQIVNSCDVLMGVHGAGLTNMVFLPDHAVVVQVVPLGGIEWFAKTDYEEPSKEMNLRYLKYSIGVKESSLSTQYAADDVVLKNPMVIHQKGWEAIWATYLVKQNVNLDVQRFRSTLLEAYLLLLHG